MKEHGEVNPRRERRNRKNQKWRERGMKTRRGKGSDKGEREGV